MKFILKTVSLEESNRSNQGGTKQPDAIRFFPQHLAKPLLIKAFAGSISYLQINPRLLIMCIELHISACSLSVHTQLNAVVSTLS